MGEVGLPFDGIGKDSINMTDNIVRVHEVARAARSASYALLFCLLIGVPSVAKAAPPPERKSVLQAVGVDFCWSRKHGAGSVSFLEEQGTDWVGNVIEFFSFVSPESEPVPQEEPDQEGKGVDEIWIHFVMIPLGCFFFGLISGFGPPGRVTHNKSRFKRINHTEDRHG